MPSGRGRRSRRDSASQPSPLVGLSLAFWSYRDLVSSEFPYLMISFLALLAIRRANAGRSDEEWRAGWAVLAAILMYGAYATQTIGIALPMAFAIAELQARRRLGRFALLTLSLVGACILIQAALLTSSTGYVSVAHGTMRSAVSNVWFYTKSVTYAWQNGFTKPAQVVLAFFLTSLAAWLSRVAFVAVRRSTTGTSWSTWQFFSRGGRRLGFEAYCRFFPST